MCCKFSNLHTGNCSHCGMLSAWHPQPSPRDFLPPSQTGCNPASVFASFSKRLPSPPREDELSRSVAGLMNGPTDTLASSIPTFPRSVSPTPYSPPASPLEGDVVIPCEFCGVALEEAVVFHHQVWKKFDKIIWRESWFSACVLMLTGWSWKYMLWVPGFYLKTFFLCWCLGQMWHASTDNPSTEQSD